MRIVKATLKKLKSDDGLIEVQDDVKIGTTYWVDIDSKAVEKYNNLWKMVEHEKESVMVYDLYEESWVAAGMFPLELLEVENE